MVGRSTANGVREWYPTLRKPWWTPPPAVFGPVWTVLYAMMGVAAVVAYRRGGASGTSTYALLLFGAHLLLNFAWSHVFFTQRNLSKASVVITALVVTLLAVISEFGKIDPTAAKLLWPYLGWTALATALTFEITRMNVV